MQKKNLFPNTDALLKAAEFRNLEIARYVVDQFQELIKKFNLHDNSAVQDMSKYLNQYADILEKEQPSMKAAMSASPDAIKRPDQIRQDNFAQEAQRDLGEMGRTTQIEMSYGISEQSDILRVYSMGEERADSSMNGKLDDILSAWLVTNELYIKNGKIYESEGGVPKLNKDGTLKTADPDKTLELFENSGYGLSEYAKQRGLNIATNPCPYPASKVIVSAQARTETKPAEVASSGVSEQTTSEIERSESGMGRQS